MVIKFNPSSAGKEMRVIRMKSGDTLEKAAKRLGMESNELLTIESGGDRPSFEFINRFAKIYKISNRERQKIKILAYSDILSLILEVPEEQLLDYLNQNNTKNVS